MKELGAQCQRCGYNKSLRALHFHHKDSSEKKLWSNGKARVSPEEVRAHPERFVVLCANCHAELHDEEAQKAHTYTTCDFCGKSFRTQPHRAVTGHGKYCSKQCTYDAWDRWALSTEAIMARFWKYTFKTEGCWLWQGQMIQGKYPCLQTKQRSGKQTTSVAHRISYEFHVGPIPKGKQLVRTCKNDFCVNPDHLEIMK
jgi:hypothetical protein